MSDNYEPPFENYQDWYQVNKKGTPLSNLNNAAIAMRLSPMLWGMFAFDEIAVTPVLMKLDLAMRRSNAIRPVNDQDVIATQAWLQQNGGLIHIGKETVQNAMMLVAHENRYHPVRDYLDGVRWDGISRVETWLPTYLGTEDTPYTHAVGRMFLIAMVARIYQPGCKMDYMLVLESAQGLWKSMALRKLVGDEYFSDCLPDIRNAKDASQHLRGKWLIEISELHATRTAASAAVKAYISRQVEIYRPPFGHAEVREGRQCVFAGTTNDGQYLTDETGNRRTWGVKVVKEIDPDALEMDRDQLFAEAVYLYRAGQHWWPDRDVEMNTIKPQQEKRYVEDVWEPKIRDFLDPTPDDKGHSVAVSTNVGPLC